MKAKRKFDISDAEDKAIQSGIDGDADSPEWSAEDFKKARPASEVLPGVAEAYKKGALRRRTRGSQKAPIKEHISIRIDQDVVKYYRRKGRGWQAKLNEDLRKLVGLNHN